MKIRKYKSSDCEQLSDLFYQTVHNINAKDYTKGQLDVWATGNVNLEEWDKSFLEQRGHRVIRAQQVIRNETAEKIIKPT